MPVKPGKIDPKCVANPRYWAGKPEPCDLCGKPLTVRFIDGRTGLGPWAIACVPCSKRENMMLGLGYGQQYDEQPNGLWMKTGG